MQPAAKLFVLRLVRAPLRLGLRGIDLCRRLRRM
jgi:hypothetical protein